MLWYLGLKTVPGAKALGNLIVILSPLWLALSLGFERDLNLVLKAPWRLCSSACYSLHNYFPSILLKFREVDPYSVFKYRLEKIVFPWQDAFPGFWKRSKSWKKLVKKPGKCVVILLWELNSQHRDIGRSKESTDVKLGANLCRAEGWRTFPRARTG